MRRTTFINKTPESGNVSRHTPQERREINERNREHRRSQRLRRTSRSRSLSGQESNEQPPSEGSSIITRSRASANQADEIDEQLVLAHGLHSGLRSEESQAIAGPVGSSNASDPFNVTPVPLNADVIRILRYFKDAYFDCLWANINFVVEEKIGKVVIRPCTPEQIMLECMEDRSRMYCLLASTACHLQHEIGEDPGINRLGLVQRGTIYLLEDVRSSRTDSRILLNAIHLYLAAKALHHLDAARAHLAGAKAILKKLMEQRIPLTVITAAMVALVDRDVACRLLEEMAASGQEVGPATLAPPSPLDEVFINAATSAPEPAQ